jgi:phage anti-repressor protein
MELNTDAHVEQPGNISMDALIHITYRGDKPTVSGRELHKALQVATRYNDWFARIRHLGFVEGKDFYTNSCNNTGGRPSIDHEITIAMAKELCMLQRSPAGRKFRRYFLECEQNWESPDQLMERAMKIAHQRSEQAVRRIMAEHELPRGLTAFLESSGPNDSFDHTGEDFLKETL